MGDELSLEERGEKKKKRKRGGEEEGKKQRSVEVFKLFTIVVV